MSTFNLAKAGKDGDGWRDDRRKSRKSSGKFRYIKTIHIHSVSAGSWSSSKIFMPSLDKSWRLKCFLKPKSSAQYFIIWMSQSRTVCNFVLTRTRLFFYQIIQFSLLVFFYCQDKCWMDFICIHLYYIYTTFSLQCLEKLGWGKVRQHFIAIR